MKTGKVNGVLLAPDTVQLQSNPVGLAKKDSGYSSHASLKSLKIDDCKNTPRPASKSPQPPMVSEKEVVDAVKPEQLVAYPVFLDNFGKLSPRMAELPAEPIAPETPPKDGPPRADFWKTQHVPKMEQPQVTSDCVSPLERRGPDTPGQIWSPVSPVTVVRPPIPKPYNSSTRASTDNDGLKTVPYTSVQAGKRPSLVETAPKRNTTQNVLQKATGRPPMNTRQSARGRSGTTSHNRSSSEDSIASLKRIMTRSSHRSSVEQPTAPLTVQKVQDVFDGDIPVVPRRLSNTFMERTKRFSELPIGAKSVGDGESKAPSEKKEKKVVKADPPPIEELEKSLRRKSLPASSSADRAMVLSSFLPIEKSPSRSGRRPSEDARSVRSNSSQKSRKSQKELRKEFEQEITDLSTISGSLGASPYDVALAASLNSNNSGATSDSSDLTIRPKDPRRHSVERGRPQVQRDGPGRIVGMDSESASRFARNRSQSRAIEQERREALLSLQGQSPKVEPTSNSNFANQLAMQAAMGVKKRRPVSMGDVPPVPVLTPQELAKQAGRGKRTSPGASSGGPPVSAMNGLRKQNQARPRSGRTSHMFSRRELSTQLEMPERLAPLPPSGSDADLSGSASASVSNSGSEVESQITPVSSGEAESAKSSVTSTSTNDDDGYNKTVLSRVAYPEVSVSSPGGSSPVRHFPGAYPESEPGSSPEKTRVSNSPQYVAYGNPPAQPTRSSPAVPGAWMSSPPGITTPTRPPLASAMSRNSGTSTPGSIASGGSPLKKVAISAAPPVVLGPKRDWVGPSAAELASMAMASKKGADVRSNSAMAAFGAGGGEGKGKEVERPNSERGFRPEEKKRGLWGSKLRGEL